MNSKFKIAVMLICSAIGGILIGDKASVLLPAVKLIMGAFKFVVIPFVFTSVILAILGIKNGLCKIATGTGVVFFALTLSAVVWAGLVAYSMPTSLFPPQEHVGANLPSLGVSEWIANSVPTNLFFALSSGNLFQILLCGVVVALAIRSVGGAPTVNRLIEEFHSIVHAWVSVLNRMIWILISLVIVWAVGTCGAQLGHSTAILILAMVLAIIAQTLITYSCVVSWFSNVKLTRFWTIAFKVWTTACATTSAAATLPTTIAAMEELGINKSISQFVAPLGSIANKGGTAIFQLVSIWVICVTFKVSLNPIIILKIVLVVLATSFSTGSIPGAGLVGLSLIIDTLGLPVAGFAIAAAADRLADMVRTPTNVVGDLAAAVVINTMYPQQTDELAV